MNATATRRNPTGHPPRFWIYERDRTNQSHQRKTDPAMTTDKKGLYFQGDFKTGNYSDAVKELYQLNEIPSGFCVNEDYEANGYSVVDGNGIQHIYELSPKKFYNAFMNL